MDNNSTSRHTNHTRNPLATLRRVVAGVHRAVPARIRVDEVVVALRAFILGSAMASAGLCVVFTRTPGVWGWPEAVAGGLFVPGMLLCAASLMTPEEARSRGRGR